MTVTCELCGSQVGDYARVCTHCSHGLHIDLADIPTLDAELDIAVAKLARIGAGERRSSEPRLPVNLSADDTGRRLKAVLAEWCSLIADQRGVPGPLDGLAPMSRWLLDHIEWLRHHPAGPDSVTEIRDAVRTVRRAIDRPRDRRYSGHCDGCGSALYASERASQAVCPVCVGPEGERTTYSVQERRDAMLSAMAVLCMAPPEASYALSILVRPIPANTIRVWAKRGKLLPAGVDDKGHSIYRLADIAALMIPTQQTS